MSSKEKLIILSAPSGAGKTTIARHLLETFPDLEFSISATSRPPRGKERNGADYYFLSQTEFQERIDRGEFLEWEEVYQGSRYGTLNAEVSRIWAEGHHVVFDIDVEGAINLKKHFGDQALALFVRVPDMKTLEQRLRSRGTESDDNIRQRLEKAEVEMRREPEFDRVIVNDNLDRACAEAVAVVSDFLKT